MVDVQGFMQAHKSFGDIAESLYGSRITVAASAHDGHPRIAIHGRTSEGSHIGGLFDVEAGRRLIEQLGDAIDYAEKVARRQRAASVPELEQRLAEARAAQDGGDGATGGKERSA